MQDYGERIRAVETIQSQQTHEIERLRDGHHNFREQLGIIGAQLGSLASQVQQISSSTELIAERAAHKVLAAWVAQQSEEAKPWPKIVLATLALAAAALGLRAGGVY